MSRNRSRNRIDASGARHVLLRELPHLHANLSGMLPARPLALDSNFAPEFQMNFPHGEPPAAARPHLGLFFQKAVDVFVVEGGRSRKIIYDQAYFDMPANSVAQQLPQGAGFAGIRLQEARDGSLDWHKNDWVAFLGAAYFRSIGELHQYGLSSRGIALDVAVADRSEEFPDFTQFLHQLQ